MKLDEDQDQDKVEKPSQTSTRRPSRSNSALSSSWPPQPGCLRSTWKGWSRSWATCSRGPSAAGRTCPKACDSTTCFPSCRRRKTRRIQTFAPSGNNIHHHNNSNNNNNCNSKKTSRTASRSTTTTFRTETSSYSDEILRPSCRVQSVGTSRIVSSRHLGTNTIKLFCSNSHRYSLLFYLSQLRHKWAGPPREHFIPSYEKYHYCWSSVLLVRIQ